MPAVWDAGRLGLEDESVVVVPSVTLDPAVPGAGSLTQAFEERLLFLLLLLRQPRLRMIYVTSMPIKPSIIEYYLALLPGVIPSHAMARLNLLSVGDSSPRPAECQAAGPPSDAVEDRRHDPEPAALPSDPVQHHRARTRHCADPWHPHVRRRPAARRAWEQDGLPTTVRGRGNTASARRGGSAQLRRRDRCDHEDARGAAEHRRDDRQAERRCVRSGQRARGSAGYR